MRPVSTALTSALVGGAIGYQVHDPISTPKDPRNPDIDIIAQRSRKHGYQEIKQETSWWSRWHRQYMYSQSVSAKPQCSFIDPKTGVTETYYSIPHRSLSNMNLVYPTILDEGLAAVAFRKLPNKVGVTGTLEVGPLQSFDTPKFSTSSSSSTNPPNTTEYHILVLRADPPVASGKKSMCSGDLQWYGSTKSIASGKVIMIEPWWGKYFAYSS